MTGVRPPRVLGWTDEGDVLVLGMRVPIRRWRQDPRRSSWTVEERAEIARRVSVAVATVVRQIEERGL